MAAICLGLYVLIALPPMNVTGPYWYWVESSLGYGLAPSSKKTHEPNLIEICVTPWRHMNIEIIKMKFHTSESL